MRRLSIHWIGPLPYQRAFYQIGSGVFMVLCGQSLLYVGGASKVAEALGSHIQHGDGQVTPGSVEGRDMMFYARNYSLPLTVKLGEIRDLEADSAVVKDEPTLKDLVRMLIVAQKPPSNPYGRDLYVGRQSLNVRNKGRFWPLEETMYAEPLSDDEVDG